MRLGTAVLPLTLLMLFEATIKAGPPPPSVLVARSAVRGLGMCQSVLPLQGHHRQSHHQLWARDVLCCACAAVRQSCTLSPCREQAHGGTRARQEVLGRLLH